MNIRVLLVLSASLLAIPARADDAALRNKIDALEQQLQSLQTDLQKIEKKADDANARTDVLAAQQESTSSGTRQTAALDNATSLFGYGEINYSRPRENAAAASVDVTRAVFGFGHRFNDKLKFVSEFEFEHAIVSKDDSGEAEVEQFYLDYTLSPHINLKSGLYLMPVGLLNENHEPTHYYGVFRNDIETRIIPTTWREIGVGLYGTLDAGLQYDTGFSSGFSMHKWDAAESPSSPLASLHQEGQFAHAADIAFYAALHYVNIPGLRIGGSVWTGNSAQGNAPLTAGTSSLDLTGINGRITMYSLDAAYVVDKLDLRALYAHVGIAQARQINDALAAPAVGFTTGFVPSAYAGGYVQAAYKVYDKNAITVAPFLRYEHYNTQQEMPEGYTAFTDPKNDEHISTIGVSFYPDKNVVFKADYQKYQADSSRDRFNLGMGLEF